MKNIKIISGLLIAFFLLIPLSYAQQYDIFTIGYGPLAGESGYPVACDSDINGNIAILDGLKNSFIVYDKNFQFSGAYSISKGVFSNIQSINFKISPDNYLYISVSDEILKYNLKGNLIKSFALKDNPYLSNMLIRNFAPLKNDSIAAKDEIKNNVFIASLDKNKEIQYIDQEANTKIIDFDSYASKIIILKSKPDISLQYKYYLSLYTDNGILIKEAEIILSNFDTNLKVSFSPDGKIYILSNYSSYSIYNDDLKAINNYMIKEIVNKEINISFTGYLNDYIVIPDSKRGVLIFNGSELLKTISPVNIEDGKFYSPSSITSFQNNIFIYDNLTNRFFLFQNEKLKRTVNLYDLIGQNITTQSKIDLYSDKYNNIYIIIVGFDLVIKKYNIENGTVKNVNVPSQISPGSSIYIRPYDGKIFAYSWFDSMLYSFDENGDNINKVFIKKSESIMYGSDNICKIDEDSNIFIYLPSLKRTNVFDNDGNLILSFTVSSNISNFFSNFDFFEEKLIFLNQSQCKLELITKRGEPITSIGEYGTILFPVSKSGYSENKGKFNFPQGISCYENKIYIADTGNSRIQIIEKKNITSRIIIELQIGSKSAYVNSKRVDLDVPPFIENGRTLVPFRFIGESLGAKVNWVQDEKKAIYELGGVKVEIIIGNTTAIVNGKQVIMDTAPKITNGRTFVPLRFVTEALGSSVIWENQTKRIVITYPG